ncbi:SDR family oxidoreductase [Frankia sp. CNm7]|uniref:SDR family oxidoreductase n=1 Tax=Frankia nepalensis TaxID=1836974 RepID=A0A937RGL9_9ACTN|nr:SDR family oxidoreductase [Frankia nepalensis]MBL7502254.1 SDR family oxidoreductase [Frankia nepalensis]MBL7516043.1 SDR family oxidoreductase [Frankia nepalensis]MBL7521375.1 SDR family oxidoreductase [Frankia nepalensis]MBL7631818.1 SDR family oxidoreductase [Frankia nepalensis]
MDLGLGGAAVVVSGGSKGMGRAAVECFAREGARVAILARGKAGLDETAEAALALGAREAVGIPTDLGDAASVAAAFEQVGARFGELNVLVNAAGPVGVGTKGFDGSDDAEWVATFDIGTLSAVRTVRAALPLLRAAQWARIVNVSAHSTRRQSPGLIAYTASKAALTSVSKNLAQSLAADGILVNTVSPGSFLSEGMKGYLRAQPAGRGIDPDSLTDAMRVIKEDFGHPAFLPRAGDPAEIGPVIAFVGSRANSYMTGADINVDGGSDF